MHGHILHRPVFQILASGLCSGAVDVDLTFDDEGSAINCSSTNNGDNVLPEEAMSFVDGLDSAGEWIFLITDVEVGDGDIAIANSVTLSICVSDTEPVLAVNEIQTENLFSIYPNPNNGEFTIQFNSKTSRDIKVEIFDIRGRSIFANSYINPYGFNETINLGNVQSGIYFVNAGVGNIKSTRKIIIN